jgi:hypothetical protein
VHSETTWSRTPVLGSIKLPARVAALPSRTPFLTSDGQPSGERKSLASWWPMVDLPTSISTQHKCLSLYWRSRNSREFGRSLRDSLILTRDAQALPVFHRGLAFIFGCDERSAYAYEQPPLLVLEGFVPFFRQEFD